MPDTEILDELPVEALVQELRAREARVRGPAEVAPPPPNMSLREFDDETIVEAVTRRQKVIYGVDHRVDVFRLPAGPDLVDVDSVVALFDAADVTDNGNGTSTLRTQNFGIARSLCAGERFRDQPIGAFCSGFLVAADLIATAGHCVNAGNVTNVRFVFGFRMRNATTAETVINNTEIYRGAAVVGRQEVGDGADWAVVRIDRPVTNHRIARIRRAGRIGDTQAVHVIGHPVGLPTKFAGGAAVRNNGPAAFFVANLDTYGGNSGSPVFNSNTHEVEGILVRGETDFVFQAGCRVSLVCPDTGCRGEDCTRTTEFANLVPVSFFPNWEMLDNNPATTVIAAGGGQLYQLHHDGNIWRYTGTPCHSGGCPGWEHLDNNPATASIAAGGAELYQLHNNGAIWRYTGPPCHSGGCPGWEQLDNNPATLQIATDGMQLYQLHNNGAIWRYTGPPCHSGGCPGWEQLDFNAATVAIAAGGGQLYQLHNNGNIWRYTGTPCNAGGCPGWELLDNNPATSSIVAGDGQLYQLHNNGNIWRYTGTPCNAGGCPGWEHLDNNPASGALAAGGGQLYQLHNNGNIWRYTGTPCNAGGCPGWEHLDNNPATKAIAAGGGQLYQVHNDGKIWRYTG